MQSNQRIWSHATFQAYLDYMDTAFATDGRGSAGVKIKTSSYEKQVGIRGWNSNWDARLTGRVELDHKQRYDELLDLIARDLDLGGKRLAERREKLYRCIQGRHRPDPRLRRGP